MNEAEVMWYGITAVIALITVTAPVIKLNGTIKELTVKMENMISQNTVRDDRLNAHSKKLDEHEKKLTEHDFVLKHLEE